MTYTAFYLAWSPRRGEATYTRAFSTEAERANFITRIACDTRNYRTWENVYPVI